jgi:hypothetical protein
MAILPRYSHTSSLQLTPSTPAMSQDYSLCSASSVTRIRSRQSWVPSRLRMFGVHQRKSLRRLCVARNGGCNAEDAQYDVVVEGHDVFVLWKLLGRGCYWRQQYPYGSIIRSLATFPVIENLYTHYKLTVEDNLHLQGVSRFQGAVNSGMLHPFTQTYVETPYSM